MSQFGLYISLRYQPVASISQA